MAPGMCLAQSRQTFDYGCLITDVSVFEDRVHVQCANAVGINSELARVVYLAVANSSPMAHSFATLAIAAKAANKPLVVSVYTDPSQNPPSCNADDCRGVAAARIFY